MWPRAPDPQSLRRILCWVLGAALSLFAIAIAWQWAMWWGLAIPFFWGVAIYMSMRSGIDQASSAAWNRKTSRAVSVGVQVFTILIVFAPALVLLALANVPATLAWGWIIVIGFTMTHWLSNRLRGPIQARP